MQICTSSSQNKSLFGLGDKLLQCMRKVLFWNRCDGIGYAVYTKVSSIYFLKFQKKKNNRMTLNLLIAEVEIC